MPTTMTTPLTVWTIGHSTLPIDAFVETLAAHRIEAIADVRRFPGSRRLPHYQADALASSLEANGIAYAWIATLGGRRRPDPASPNTAWRHPAFRAYADHVESEEFADGLQELLAMSLGVRTAIMCAEVLWWRCHRRLIADVLVSIGVDVLHVRGTGDAEPHRLTAPARLERGVLTYRERVRG